MVWTKSVEGRTECTDGQTDGRRQNYIPPTLSGDINKYVSGYVSENFR